MPSIEITQEQYNRYLNGDAITVESPNKRVKNVLVVPSGSDDSDTWQHMYFVYDGKITKGGTHIEMYDFLHLVGRNGEPVVEWQGRRKNPNGTAGLVLGTSWCHFKVIDPTEL